jgi:hypothetical protein
MKNLNKKVIVSTLALAMGATLAGSISGTVAWFQYSTRAQAAYIGTSAHCSEMLEVSCDGGSNWKSDLTSAMIDAAKTGGTSMTPITSGALAKDAAAPTSFYNNPIYQIVNQANWGEATNANYVQFTLQFHVKDIDGVGSTYLAKNLYLTDLTIVDESTPADLYKAVRVHFAAGTSYKLFARDNGSTDAEISTPTSGNLDLNNDGVLDKQPGYEWDTGLQTLTYGSGSQVAFNANGTNVLADDSNPNSITANSGLIGQIPGNAAGLSVTVTIWLEGWQQLSAKPEGNATTGSAIWDAATYINKAFKVGMRFGCNAHTAHNA